MIGIIAILVMISMIRSFLHISYRIFSLKCNGLENAMDA